MPERQPPHLLAPLRPLKRDSRHNKKIVSVLNAMAERRNDAIIKAEAMLESAPPAELLERLLAAAKPANAIVQPELFPDLVKQDAPPKARPPRLYAAARLREDKVLKMTLKGVKVREIASALKITKKAVYEIRARLRVKGRLHIPARLTGQVARKK